MHIPTKKLLTRYLDKPLPQGWEEDTQIFQQVLPVDDQWWKAFQDPVLDSLISVAVKQNYSVLTAIDRINMAKANLRMERGNFFPTIGLNAGWTRQQSSGNTSDLPQSTQHYYDASLNMSWELDLFGSIRNRVKAQKENFAASKEEYTGTMISLCAQVASAYINLRELQQELAVVQKNCASQEAVLKITEVRYNTGLVSKLDVAQAKSVFFSTKASIPQIESGINQYITTLAILLGTYPQEVRPALTAPGTLPDYMEPIGVGLPADLLLRRPDIRSAERSVNAQAALVGASKSDWLPQVFLKGSVGYAAKDLKDLTHHKSMTYEIAPALSWTLFKGTQLVNATKLAKAQLDEAINQFNQTVLTAVQETDNAMNAYRNSIKQIVALREVRNQGQETLTLSLELYKQGLTPFQNVLDAQRSLLSYENQLVQARGYSLLQLIAMYQALGGGWSGNLNN
ncbi:TolC family protein [Bacteroides fragilis]|uniref:TolC family protein n=1 Tax=Bacteroides fragilis TaxID=817 RepID=UPI00321A17C3